MKKTLLLFSLLLAICASAWAGNDGITIMLRSGQKVSFTFNEKPVLSVSDTSLSLSASGVPQISYPYADVRCILFDEADVPSGIAAVPVSEKPNVKFCFSSTFLTATGLVANERVHVYSAEGRLLLRLKAQPDGCLQLPMASFRQGINIVRATQSGISYKLYKR